MDTELLQELAIISAIINVVMIVLFFVLVNNVSKIKRRLDQQKGLEVKFKADSAEFRNDPKKLNYFMDYIYFTHIRSSIPVKQKKTLIKEYYDRIKEIGGEDFVPEYIKTEYKL